MYFRSVEIGNFNSANMADNAIELWTIGHSTRSIEEFIEALKSFQIESLVDVRSFPSSRRYPQFGATRLSESLRQTNIEYLHLPELGGRRRARKDSLNIAWRNEGFRGYADYMETEAFRQGIERLLALARDRRLVIMCAEAVWWRCHRSLISDYLKVKGVEVAHVIDATHSQPHPFTSAAQIIDGQLSYRGLLGEQETHL